MMKRYITPLITFIILTCLLVVKNVQANMLISPMRVVLNDRERSTEVILINTSNKTKSFRVDWAQKKALSNGGYLDLDDKQATSFPIASKMFRVSPKQVTLKPGARQIVKLAARRPKGLLDGEYRSHLKFTALPTGTADNGDSRRTGIRLNLLLNYSIPIILRKGPMDYNVVINDANVKEYIVEGNLKREVNISMSRTGKNSTFGSLVAYWTPSNGGDEQRVGVLNSLNFFAELNQASRNIYWQFPDVTPRSGILRVTYEGAKEYQGQLLAEKIIRL